MERYIADRVELHADVDYGEGGIEFYWPDPVFGYESFRIDMEGHCSRRMPIYSGSGLEAIDLARDRVRFRFSELLARQLRLGQDVEIAFAISDEDFEKLKQALNFVMGVDEAD